MPEDVEPGEYRVIAGFYAQGERLSVRDAYGNELGTYIELGTIQVARDTS